jgi:hypothetical protein
VCTGVNRLRVAAASCSSHQHENEESRGHGPEAHDHSLPPSRWQWCSHAMSTGQGSGGFRVRAGYRLAGWGIDPHVLGPNVAASTARSGRTCAHDVRPLASRAEGPAEEASRRRPSARVTGRRKGRGFGCQVGERRESARGTRVDSRAARRRARVTVENLWNVWVIPTCRPRSGGAGGEVATENRPDFPPRARAPVVPVPWRGSAVRPI